jgi:hypothetical protein
VSDHVLTRIRERTAAPPPSSPHGERQGGGRRTIAARPGAFTSLIMLLIALLLPAMGKSRKLARRTWCLSNLRQMVAGMHAFADENGSHLFPIDHTPGQYWHSRLMPYFGDEKLILCSEATTPSYGWGSFEKAWGPSGGFMDNMMGSYGMNLWFLPTGAFENDGNMEQGGYYYSTASVNKAADVPVFGDSPWVGAWPDDTDFFPPDLTVGWSNHQHGYFMGRFCIDRHEYAIDVGFDDGHAANVSIPGLWGLQWHRNYNPTTPP